MMGIQKRRDGKHGILTKNRAIDCQHLQAEIVLYERSSTKSKIKWCPPGRRPASSLTIIHVSANKEAMPDIDCGLPIGGFA